MQTIHSLHLIPSVTPSFQSECKHNLFWVGSFLSPFWLLGWPEMWGLYCPGIVGGWDSGPKVTVSFLTGWQNAAAEVLTDGKTALPSLTFLMVEARCFRVFKRGRLLFRNWIPLTVAGLDKGKWPRFCQCDLMGRFLGIFCKTFGS